MEVDDCLTFLSRGGGNSAALPLDCLVEQLGSGKKDECIMQLLSHRDWLGVFKTLLKLLNSPNLREAGNSAYVIGLIPETELGRLRLTQAISECPDFLKDLVALLNCSDDEATMNAAGALGTLAETAESRDWLLSQRVMLSEGVAQLSCLLTSKYSWISSNSALVFARLGSSEDGCVSLLNHSGWSVLVTRLIESLGREVLGSGVNAAIALGRFMDVEPTRDSLLNMPHVQAMIEGLGRMLSSEDCNVRRNACYSLSCLVSSKQGQEKILQLPIAFKLLENVACLITSNDTEATQFAVATLHSLVSESSGRTKVQHVHAVETNLEAVYHSTSLSEDVREQVTAILQLLVDLPEPSPPTVQCTGPYTITASWATHDVSTTRFSISYELWHECKVVSSGFDCSHTLSGLTPLTTYNLRLRLKLGEHVSAFSMEKTVTTHKAAPGAPQNFSITGRTQTQVKLGWDPPEVLSGSLKGYKVLVDDVQLLCKPAKSKSCIVPGLECGTTHQFEVMAITSKGDSEVAVIVGGPLEAGDHCPSKPQLTVLGRREIFVSWSPPIQPLGRIMKYEVKQNGQVIYSGIELQYKCKRLTPYTDYTITVCVVTTEGRHESPPARKRTAQDFCPARPTLIHSKVKTTARLAGSTGGLRSGSRMPFQSSRKLQSRSGLLSSASSTHLQASCTELSSTESKTESRPMSRAREKTDPLVRKAVRPRSASVGSRHRATVPRDRGTVGNVNSTAECKDGVPSPASKAKARTQMSASRLKEKGHRERAFSAPGRQPLQFMSKRGRSDVNKGHDKDVEEAGKAKPEAAVFHKEGSIEFATLRGQHADLQLAGSESCVTLVSSITCLPQAATYCDKERRPSVRQGMKTANMKMHDMQPDSPPVGKQRYSPHRFSRWSQSTPIVQAPVATSKLKQTRRSRFNVVAQTSVPFVPPSIHVPRPLPFHLRRQHQHRVHIQQQHLMHPRCQIMPLGRTTYSRQYQPVRVTLQDVLLGMRRSGLPARRPITPAAAKSSI